MEGEWLLVWFGGFTLVHVVVLAAMLRRLSVGDGRTEAVDETDVRTCPECGTRNAPEYRYCRACVSALGAGRAPGAGDRPGSRRVP